MTFRTRIIFLTGLVAAAGLTGCYERVVSERPFAGMTGNRNLPTAPDYTEAQAEFFAKHKARNEKPFDPIGDWIVKPIGGVAEGIGNAFSGEEEPTTKGMRPPARPATSAGDVNTPPPAPKEPTPPADPAP